MKKTQKALGVVPDMIFGGIPEFNKKSDKERLVDFIDKIWEDGLVLKLFKGFFPLFEGAV